MKLNPKDNRYKECYCYVVIELLMNKNQEKNLKSSQRKKAIDLKETAITLIVHLATGTAIN